MADPRLLRAADAELAECLPKLAKAGKLRLAPVGEVYNALEKKIRAGSLPDVEGVTSFYADRSHPPGCPGTSRPPRSMPCCSESGRMRRRGRVQRSQGLSLDRLAVQPV